MTVEVGYGYQKLLVSKAIPDTLKVGSDANDPTLSSYLRRIDIEAALVGAANVYPKVTLADATNIVTVASSSTDSATLQLYDLGDDVRPGWTLNVETAQLPRTGASSRVVKSAPGRPTFSWEGELKVNVAADQSFDVAYADATGTRLIWLISPSGKRLVACGYFDELNWENDDDGDLSAPFTFRNEGIALPKWA